MAMTFRFVLAAPPDDPTSILVEVEEPLADLGLRRSREIVRVDLERDAPDETAYVVSLAAADSRLWTWQGLSVEYTGADLTFDLTLYRWGAEGFVNGYIGVHRETLPTLFATGRDELLKSAVLSVANGMALSGGVAATGLRLEPLNPDSVVATFFDNPVNRGAPCAIGVFQEGMLVSEQIDALKADNFSLQAQSGFWWVEDRDFVEVLTARDRTGK